jgi:hypothetical protein
VRLVEVLLLRRIAMKKRPITLVGTVQKLIERSLLKEKPYVHLAFAGADYLYDSLRIPNTHGWEEGRDVEITIRLL